MADPFFFGYGSLVNRATHDFPEAAPARLAGWRRVWRHTDLRPLAFLTAEPAAECTIDGLVAHVPGDDWVALDARERAYVRASVTPAVAHDIARPVEVQVYEMPADLHRAPDAAHPLLLSYIDVVVQGFLREFGEAGVWRFFETTAGWDAPIHNDRAAPIYARAQRLTDAEVSLVNEGLSAVGARI